MFCECRVTKTFWDTLTQWLSTKNLKLSNHPKCIILGQDYNLVNTTLEFINLLAKYYIYCCKIMEHEPTLHGFIQKLFYVEGIEKYISLSRDTYTKHKKKWKFLN